MSDRALPGYAEIEQPAGSDFPVVHCPICGAATMEIGENGGEVTPCSHLAFIYVGEVGEFEYQSEDFQIRLEGQETGNLSLESFGEVLKTADYGNKLLALEITHGGGPVWFTDVYGFDYSTSGTRDGP